MLKPTLREFEEDDWPSLQECLSGEEVVRYVEFEPFTEESAQSFIRWANQKAQETPRTFYILAVVLPEEGKLIGTCSLIVRDTALREADIGFIIGRSYWGRGCATEAARALSALGFEQLGLHRIFAECDPANVGSARVMEKVGMAREGCRRECKWQKGQWRDRLLYALLDHEWENHGHRRR